MRALYPDLLAVANTALEKAESATFNLNTSPNSSISRFLAILNSTLYTSYDSLLMYRKPYPSLFLPHNLWGDDYVLGICGESPWKLTSHGASIELCSQWASIRDELRFAHSVVVTSDDSSPLFIATQVNELSLHSLDASFSVRMRVLRPLHRSSEESHDEQQTDGA